LLEAVTKVTEVLRDKNKKLRSAPSPFSLLGPESLFVGQIHYGDFYNRVPDKAFMQGTRRWHPDKTYEQIKFEFEKMLGSISLDERILIDNNWIYVGDSYEVSQSELIVKSLINAFESVHNKSCPVRGHGSVTDVCRLVSRAKIPAVLCGFGTETGHADYEFVTMEKVKRSCEIALQTVMNYLNSG
jgi:acetylornithine deacetylase/succinyl-diaminopimelate desuccinylase-like protein